MGVKGRRIISTVNEPTLLGDIDSIIAKAKNDGFITQRGVDIVSIVKNEGILIQEEILPSSISGSLFKSDGRWIIRVNKNHHIHRQRFTIAHEFAHYCLHKSDNEYFEDEIFFRDENLSSIEYAANTFAARLIMPDPLIREAISNGTVSLSSLSEKFNVSLHAMKNKVENLGYKIVNDEE